LTFAGLSVIVRKITNNYVFIFVIKSLILIRSRGKTVR